MIKKFMSPALVFLSSYVLSLVVVGIGLLLERVSSVLMVVFYAVIVVIAMAGVAMNARMNSSKDESRRFRGAPASGNADSSGSYSHGAWLRSHPFVNALLFIAGILLAVVTGELLGW